jgi:hypothetical protein
MSGIEVSLPLIFDLSGLDVLLYGERFEIAEHVIYARDPLPLEYFYDAGGNGWLKYIQNENEDTFDVAINDISRGYNIKDSIKNSLHISGGSVYDIANKDISNLDAGTVFNISGFSGYYYSLQDFIIGYFSWKIIGHPCAVAAISNDSAIRNSVSDGFDVALDQLLDLSENKLNVIVQQIMDQDMSRFSLDNVGVWNTVRWLAGDRVRLHISLKNNTYTLGGTTNKLPVSARPDNYMVEFTLA